MAKYVTEEHFDRALADHKAEIKSELRSFRNEVLTRFDEVVRFLSRLDQERVFSQERFRRIETDVERIKGHLKLS